ncbi:MAG: M48 family metallopeptidase [Oscillospiraceae bacterium]|nr:M48 family metallopeptidase [Oscillospiraceae bacterium]
MSDYEIIRSARRSIALNINPDGTVTVRAPLFMPEFLIKRFVENHKNWIEKQREKRKALENVQKLTARELKALKERGKSVFRDRAEHFSPLLGVKYNAITVRSQKTRWGSCSGKGNLSFNCLLLLAPPEVLDSVVAHELCHLLEPNHSERFYALLLRVFPDYRRCRSWLNKNGPELTARLP